MEVKPIHILAASAVAFLAIIAANMIVNYQNNADFRDKLTERFSSATNLRLVRDKLVSEEQMTPVPSDDNDDEG